MTKQLTRQAVEAVVERLNKDRSCFSGEFGNIEIGSRLSIACLNWSTLLGFPIYIGHVLSKIDKTVGGRNYYIGQTTYNNELIHLWSLCGELTQSLQEIIEVSGWKEVRIPPEGWYEEQGGCSCHINPPCSFCEYSTYEEVLTSPEANALCQFILSLFPIDDEK